jgi:glycosyltransferase involved in cell wall biosynthesis
LLIVGFCPDKSPLIELIDGNDRIILKDPVWYDDVIQLIQDCSIFVLPSRTEAMGRVLLEAMAAKKPIIASNVDGIPTYIKHGYNGLLFESENVDDLAIKIKDVLNNSEYATTLAENAYAYVNLELSEEKYVEAYRDFVERVVNG